MDLFIKITVLMFLTFFISLKTKVFKHILTNKATIPKNLIFISVVFIYRFTF